MDSNLISLIGIIVSSIISVISIIIAILTLKQNSKMIEESTRPYISIYSETTYFESTDYYLIIKNFGSSGAKITKFSSEIDLLECSLDNSHRPFENIENTFLAPNQSLKCNLDAYKMHKKKIGSLEFHIEYQSGRKKYSDDFSINLAVEYNLIKSRSSTENHELKIISFTLQDLVEKLL